MTLLVTSGPPWRPSMTTAMMPLVAARNVVRISWTRLVMYVRSRSSARRRTLTPSRPVSSDALIRSMRRGRRRRIGMRVVSSSVAALRVRVQLLGEVVGGEAAGLGDEVEVRSQAREGAFYRCQAAEHCRDLRWDGEAVVGDDVEQVCEHCGVGYEAGGDVTGEEPAEGAAEPVFVEVVRTFADLEWASVSPAGSARSTARSSRWSALRMSVSMPPTEPKSRRAS